GIGLGIPAALLAFESILVWFWFGGTVCPALIVLMMFFGLFGRPKEPKTDVSQQRSQTVRTDALKHQRDNDPTSDTEVNKDNR
ncbi:MAG TPA: hypothetical protein VK171_04995, partial [Fimbriimonas sp.]|nr:hypothetical protein [Fimbriimonas sp.]